MRHHVTGEIPEEPPAPHLRHQERTPLFSRPEHCDLQHGPNTSPRCHVKAYAKQFPIYKDKPEKDITFDATPLLGGDMGVPASDRTIAWLRSRLPELKLVVLVKSRQTAS